MTSLSKNARIAGVLYVLASAVGFVRLISSEALRVFDFTRPAAEEFENRLLGPTILTGAISSP